MASAALVALENDRFLANPAREKPVSQFGITMTLDGRQGVLLANFTPHNDKLELEALAFREERFFEAEAGNIEMVVLDRARHLSEIKPHQPTVGADALNALQLKQATAGDPAAEAKALEKDIKRFQNQTMHRQMASKLAKTHIKEGRYNSRLTALPAAHATVLGARVKKLVADSFPAGVWPARKRQASATASAAEAFRCAARTAVSVQQTGIRQFLRGALAACQGEHPGSGAIRHGTFCISQSSGIRSRHARFAWCHAAQCAIAAIRPVYQSAHAT